MAQSNQITLSVDDDGDGSNPVSEVYDNLQRVGFRGEYLGTNHTSLDRDMMTLYHTPAKRTSSFYGVDKAAVKFTDDIGVDTPQGVETVSPIIFQVNASVPVGATAAEIEHAKQRVISALMHSTLFEDLLRGMV